MRTASITPANIKKDWFVVDATGKTVGRLASQIANVLRGKHKANFVPHLDCGDFVVVTNVDQIHLTGRKWHQKTYYHHSSYVGGIKAARAEELKTTYPDRILRNAVSGMLPKNKLRKRFLRKLKIYTDDKHPHAAQQPAPLKPRTANGE